MDELLQQLVAGQKEILGRFDVQEKAIQNLQSDVSEVKGQLEENTAILRALEHQSQVQKAELSNLIITTARLEGEVKGLRTDVNTIEAVTAKNWTDIVQLKAVK
jgi:chromosome segregation ATPase